jgi:hypothetical protein
VAWTALPLALAAAALVPAPPALAAPPIQCVLFTHIEDNTPGGMLGTQQSEQSYLLYRGRLIEMGLLAQSYGVAWSLQPDWKILEAALLYEDSALVATTNGKNFLRHLKEDLGAIIDPHSHENGGYNYTDVAHLLDSLGVGATTVIGGHIWDPALPQFQEWDRYRVPVAGEHYPAATWRGDILMGSGTPSHVDDPLVSGVWRPRDRDHYFEHDSTANIAAVGQYKGTIASIAELVALYESGDVPSDLMLTWSFPIRPAAIVPPGGIAAIEDTVIRPMVALRDSGLVVLTDFTSLIETWQSDFASRGFLFDAEATTGVARNGYPCPDGAAAGAAGGATLVASAPNPFARETTIRLAVAREGRVRVAVFDAAGREVATLVDEVRGPGEHRVAWDGRGAPSGVYFCRLDAAGAPSAPDVRRLVLIR